MGAQHPSTPAPIPPLAAATAPGHPMPCGDRVTSVCCPHFLPTTTSCSPDGGAGGREGEGAAKHGCVSTPSVPFRGATRGRVPNPHARPQSPRASLGSPGTSPTVSQSFLLYNEAHGMCVEAKGQELTVTTCQPAAAAQRFQWLQGGRLWGWGSQRCITATHGQNLALVRLEPCRDDDTLQRWECRDGGLLALAGYSLYFNYGNNKQRTVMLYTGDREWSRWVIHGSKDDVCSRSGQSR